MQIRKAQIEDKEKLIKLLLEFYNSTQNSLSRIQAQFREYSDPHKVLGEEAENFISGVDICFVAEENEDVVGLVVGEIREKRGRVYNREGYIEKWYVTEKYQGQSVGKELFDRLVEEFKELGCTHIALDTHLENTKAIQIYEHMGFTKRLVTFFKPLKNL